MVAIFTDFGKYGFCFNSFEAKYIVKFLCLMRFAIDLPCMLIVLFKEILYNPV